MFAKILLPIDIAEEGVAAEAIAMASALATAFESRLRLIAVATPLVVASPIPVVLQQLNDQIGVYERAELQRLATKIDRPKATVSTIVRIGRAYPRFSPKPRSGGPI